MEEVGKRSRLSVILITLAAIATIGIGVFFLVKMVTHNALAGSWYSEQEEITVNFQEEDIVVISASDSETGEETSISFRYTMDKKTKIVNLELTNGNIQDLVNNKGQLLREKSTEDSLKTMETQFEYSIQGNKLTLIEREYGDKIEFVRR